MPRHLTKLALVSAVAIGISGVSGIAAADTLQLRASGLVSTHKHHIKLEKDFYGSLAKKSGLDVAVNYNPLDVVGINMQDTLRMVKSGAFDIVETTIGSAARDDPFLEGIDLIGVSTTMDELRESIDAYRDAFSKRVAEKFNAKTLTLWPYGPQVFYCKADIKTLSDFKGLKVRSYTPSMSALVKYLGATPVTLQFKEVYPALQRGVADCAITSPTSGNTGKWPEVTTHFLPLGISWSVNGHFMNLDKWNALSADQKSKLTAAFKDFEKGFWNLAKQNNGWAIACNTGGAECKNYNKFNMKLVSPSAADRATVQKAAVKEILPTWKKTCDGVYAECSKIWDATIGKVRKISTK